MDLLQLSPRETIVTLDVPISDVYNVCVYRFDEEEEAIARANATPFGLASELYTYYIHYVVSGPTSNSIVDFSYCIYPRGVDNAYHAD